MYLHVQIIEAVDVPAMDPDGLSDPFVRMYMNDKKKEIVKTKVIEDTLSPVWNESFSFSIRNSLPGTTLHISLYDEDVIRSDKISDIDFPFQQLPPGKLVDQWLDMNPWRGVPFGGRLHVVFHLAGPSEVPFKPAVAAAKPRVSVVAPAPARPSAAAAPAGPPSPFAPFDLSIVVFIEDTLHPESDGQTVARRVERVAKAKGYKSVTILSIGSSVEECTSVYDSVVHGPKSLVLLILSNDTTRLIKLLPAAVNNTNFVVEDTRGARPEGEPVLPDFPLGAVLKNPIDFAPIVNTLSPKVAFGKDADLFLGNYAYAQGLGRVFKKEIGAVVRFSTPSHNSISPQEQAKFLLNVAEFITSKL
jgi:hypothetical protein